MRLATLAALLSSLPSMAAEPDYSHFENKIRPILVEQCQSCHSEAAAKAGKLKGNLKLDTREGLLKGGDNGPALVAGKPGESLLLKTLKYDGDIQMPPTGKLDAKITADFEKWIAAGAPDPRTAKEASTGGIDLAKGREFWAFRVPQIHRAPATTNPWAKTDLDKFVLAKLTEKGLKPVAPADKRTLIRRVTLDLTGLPPTSDEVGAFEKDSSPEAFAGVVDRLLKSKQYGERGARMWLDVARYAEDQAHTFAVTPRTNAFRYRDWVIDAFNADMPYDRFVKLQIAGDLMADESLDPTTKIAGLGFLGLGAEYYKNTFKEQAVADELDDRVDTLTRGFLGLTVSCARCHDHKFDPIPQRDYYSLAGIFNGTNLANTSLASTEETKKYSDSQKAIKDGDDKVKAMLTDGAKKAVTAATPDAAKYLVAAQKVIADKKKTKAMAEELAKAEKLNRYFLDRWVKALEASANSQPLAPLKEFAQPKPDLDGFTKKMTDAVKAMRDGKPTGDQAVFVKAFLTDAAAPFFVPPADAEKTLIEDADKTKLVELRATLDAAKKAAPTAPPTAAVLTGAGTAMKVFIRGNPLKFGDLAPKGFLQILGGSTAPAKDFTRLDLANSIASKTNPLTARVIVNRVWQAHFGRGLVSTPSNFGKLGGPPSHPELLDTLAVGFMEQGWSLKWLHRQIVLSATYQLSSANDPANAAIDGDNTYLWKSTRHRLDIEQWRDGLLSVAGHLDPTAGGPTYNLADANNKRRTVYAKISRHELDGLLRLFDFPDANVTADKRTSTTVPQQQLFALNSEFMTIQAKAFAARIEKAATDDAERVKAAYRMAYQRTPSDRELSLGVKFAAAKANPADKLTRWQQYAQILLASNELMYVD